MGGYVTSTRWNYEAIPHGNKYITLHKLGNGTVDVKEAGPAWTPNGVPTGSSFSLPFQTTTSWRTGRGAPQPLQDESEVLDNQPSTLAGEFAFLEKFQAYDQAAFPTGPDNGHTFSTVKYGLELSHPDFFLNQGSTGWSYRGPLVPWDTVSNGTQWIGGGATSSSTVNQKGSICISATAPTAPKANLGVALLESTIDGIPKLPGYTFRAGEDFLRKLAHGHLSLQFDWLPFVSDLRAAITAMLHASKLLRQYQRDSGRPVRRAFSFPTTISTGAIQASNSSPRLSFPGVIDGTGSTLSQSNGSSRLIRLTRTTQDVWFKGRYIYYLTPRQTNWDAIDVFESKANHLLGLELTPELLWELAPWSWLIDWKFHLGRILKTHAEFARDQLVLQYGYLMVKTTWENTLTMASYDLMINGVFKRYPSITVNYVTQRKERFRATPYGFGVDPASFSTMQWSILGALGLTRSPNKLRQDN